MSLLDDIAARPAAPRHSPAHRPARVGRDVVEDVLLEIRSLSRRVDRRPIVNRLEEALKALQHVQQSPLDAPDHLDRLESGRRQLVDAVETIEGMGLDARMQGIADRLGGVERMLGQAREAVIDAVVAVQPEVLREDLRARAEERVPEPEAFTLSRGVPRLHALDRDPLRTHVDVTPDAFMHEELGEEASEDVGSNEISGDEQYELDLRDFGGDDDEDARSAIPEEKKLTVMTRGGPEDATELHGIEGELAHLRRIARTALEEIGACSNLRRLRDVDRYHWDAQAGFEQRICDAMDMLMVLAQPFFMTMGGGARYPGLNVLEEVVRWGRDGLTVDPSRSFSRAMVLGSVAGDDCLRAAVLALRQSHPLTYGDQVDALALAANPAVDEALLELTRDMDARLVAAALDGLYVRGRCDTATVVPLLEHPDDRVRARAVRLMALSPDREAAATLLGDVFEQEIDDDVTAAAAEALVFLGKGVGVGVVRELLLEELEEQGSLRGDIRARMMQLLAVAGRRADHELLEALYAGQPGEAVALGLHGHVGLVPRLLDVLHPLKPEVITGPSGQREAAAALSRITGAPMYVPSEPIDPYDVVTDWPAWNAWWEGAGERFDPAVRYRFGEPWQPLDSIDELEREAVPFGLRRLLALEIGASLHERPMNPYDFAARQKETLEHQRASVQAAFTDGSGRLAAGFWPGDATRVGTPRADEGAS